MARGMHGKRVMPGCPLAHVNMFKSLMTNYPNVGSTIQLSCQRHATAVWTRISVFRQRCKALYLRQRRNLGRDGQGLFINGIFGPFQSFLSLVVSKGNETLMLLSKLNVEAESFTS